MSNTNTTILTAAQSATNPLNVLRQALVEDGVIHRDATWTRLDGGRTNFVWQVNAPTRSLVCKLFRRGAATPLFPNDIHNEARAMKALRVTEIAPQFQSLHHTPLGSCILYAHLEGTPWSPKTTGTRCDVSGVAHLLARVHRQPAISGLREVSVHPRVVIAQGDAMLSEVGVSIRRQLQQCRPEPCDGIQGKPLFLHGDPVPGNIITSDSGLRLIDWQCPAFGDPLHDLAIFLSPAMQTLAHGRPLSHAQKTQCLNSYGDDSVTQRLETAAPALGWRMAVYCAWRMARGHADYALALKAELQQLQQMG